MTVTYLLTTSTGGLLGCPFSFLRLRTLVFPYCSKVHPVDSSKLKQFDQLNFFLPVFGSSYPNISRSPSSAQNKDMKLR